MKIDEFIIFFKNNILAVPNPSILFDKFFEEDIISYFPELLALKGCKQDPIWHPEGDVLVHTKFVLEKAKIISENFNNDFDKLKILLFAICHDLGKPNTTIYSKGRWRSPGHEVAGIEITRSFLNKFNYEIDLIKEIEILVKEHLVLIHLYKAKDKVSDKAIKKLINRVDVDFLIHCVKADYFGRIDIEDDINNFEPEIWIKNRIQNLIKINTKSLFLTGKILLELGFNQGQIIGKTLKHIFILEKNGIIKNREEAIIWAKDRLKKKD